MVASSAEIDVSASWTTNAMAPATTYEVKLASYLIVAAAYEDFVPEGPHETAPRDFSYFLEEVKGDTVSDASLGTAKMWMNATGETPYFINPVNSIMSSEHGLTLTKLDTYKWRIKMTTSNKEKSRLCASSDGKNNVSRLKSMLPLVARFILAEGPAKMWGQIQAAREADPNSDEPSPKKAAVKRSVAEVPLLFLLFLFLLFMYLIFII
jgi:hypothetical protein